MFTLVVVSACGGEDEPKSSGPKLTKDNISQRTTAAMVAEGSMHFEMTVEAGDGVILMEGDQVVGETFDDSKFDFTYSEVSEDEDEPVTNMSMVLVDGIIYADLGEASDDMYVRVDPKNSSSEMGQAFSSMVDELDITKSVSSFADAITDVEQKGSSKKIDGVMTTPYSVSVDVDKAIESGALDTDSGIRPGTTLHYIFYLDKNDLLRRMESSIDSAHVQMDMTKFGEPVDIVAPGPDEFVEESELGEAA